MGNYTFKPPLTLSALEEIQDRNFYHKDVRRLLWEIKRLRAIVLRADQLQKSITSLPGGDQAILDALRNQLDDEPCVQESQHWKEDLLNP